MKPNPQLTIIDNNINRIRQFIQDVIIAPKRTLATWAKITNQTPAVKIGYIGQHLASLITGIQGTASGARGDDLADGTEVKSCNKIDQVDKCKDCGSRVLRIESTCPKCQSPHIIRKDDSKWLFSIRDKHELDQYTNLDRIILLLMDYPNFNNNDFKDIRISAFEIYPKDKRMSIFNDLVSNYYNNIFLPKQNANEKTNPMNLHPWSFQFYKCNPIKTFECIIKDIDTHPQIIIDTQNYIQPIQERDNSIEPIPMPSTLLNANEWDILINKTNYQQDIEPLINPSYLKLNNINQLTREQFIGLSTKDKALALPFLDQKLRNFIPLRQIVSSRQKRHYQRG